MSNSDQQELEDDEGNENVLLRTQETGGHGCGKNCLWTYLSEMVFGSG